MTSKDSVWVTETGAEKNALLTNSKKLNYLKVAFRNQADVCLLFSDHGQAIIWELESEAVPGVIDFCKKEIEQNDDCGIPDHQTDERSGI